MPNCSACALLQMRRDWIYSAAAAGREMVIRNGCRTSLCGGAAQRILEFEREILQTTGHTRSASSESPASTDRVPSARRHLTIRRCTRRIRLVRTNSAIAMLLAWLLAGSGFCLCLGAIPDQPTSHSHDCGTEPTVPVSDQDASCERGCNAEDAVRARAELRTVVELAAGIDMASPEVPIEHAAELASSPPARYPQAERAPKAPPYILHSVLLI